MQSTAGQYLYFSICISLEFSIAFCSFLSCIFLCVCVKYLMHVFRRDCGQYTLYTLYTVHYSAALPPFAHLNLQQTCSSTAAAMLQKTCGNDNRLTFFFFLPGFVFLLNFGWAAQNTLLKHSHWWRRKVSAEASLRSDQTWFAQNQCAWIYTDTDTGADRHTDTGTDTHAVCLT